MKCELPTEAVVAVFFFSLFHDSEAFLILKPEASSLCQPADPANVVFSLFAEFYTTFRCFEVVVLPRQCGLSASSRLFNHTLAHCANPSFTPGCSVSEMCCLSVCVCVLTISWCSVNMHE